MIFTFKIPYISIFTSSLFIELEDINLDKEYVSNNIRVIQMIDWLVELNSFISDAYVQDTFTENNALYITIAIVIDERIYKRLMLTNPTPTILLKVPHEKKDLEFKATFSDMERIE